MSEVIQMIQEHHLGKILINPEMKKYTTYRVGGPAKAMVLPKSVKALIKLIRILKQQGIKFKIIGNGSNLIFPSCGYDGIIIHLENLDHLVIENTTVKVGAGYGLMKLAYKVSRKGLSGLEFATGIPGSVGGAVFMNAGAYKSDMGYVVSSVLVLTPEYEIKRLTNKQLAFHYRTSFLQKNPGYICLEATFELKQSTMEEVMDLVLTRREKRVMNQPLEYPSAGSVFRNPEGNFAGKLIEDCGLKGYHINDAYVSEKHANFIVNKGNATGDDVINLIRYVQSEVKKEYNIDLLVEQEIVE